MKLAFDKSSILRSAMYLALLVGGLATSLAHADETEVFRSSNENSNSRPKVLVIFDNSGSMNDVVPNSRPAYDPTFTYPQVPGIQSDRLYWTTSNTGDAPTLTEAATQNFEVSKNRCASSSIALRDEGKYTDDSFMMIRSGSNRTWARLEVTNNTIDHYDCRADVTSGNASNLSFGNGFPRNNGDRTNGYGATVQNDVGAGFRITRVYTANYMNWRRSTQIRDLRRIEIARNVISGIVNSNPGIDFGLAVFNRNVGGNNGGRVVRRIIENMSATDRSGLVNIINGLQPLTNTPLCETMFEVYRYFSDGDMLYGLQATNNELLDGPARDTAAERTVARDYLSPVGDCQNVYVILMTDGEPTQDTDANGRIKALTGKTCRTYSGAENCMPELAEYMFTQDIDGITTNGVQRAITYTIGFTTNQTLLADTAQKGGGQYYTAGDTDELTSAFQGAINTILEVNSSFTSPAVAVDSFTRTESRNEVFYAMFRPTEGTNWPGNIKKLRVQVATDGSARLVDQAGQSAIDATTGFIRDQATTFWGSTADGPSVQSGGVGERLVTLGAANRRIFTNTGNNGALQAFSSANLNRNAYGFTTDAQLFSRFGVTNQAELDELLAWSRGYTDGTATATRSWILGDIIHSRPLVLNYGIRSTTASATSEPDLRVVVGTNAGFVHMFNNANGNEDWAFFPKELAPVLKPRKDDLKDGNKVWGVDGPIVAYRFDANQDGNIRSGGDDRMIVFFGLRRGGRALYAMDVTDPDNPTFLWRISNETAGLEELGETWSVPVVTAVPGYRDATSGRVKPVLVLGGGYDKVNDDKAETASTTPDIMGRGIFVIDAVTGAKVWSVTPAATSANNKQETRFVHAMPAPPSVIDSNGDGLADRIYIPDLGGNVWRIDMPGSILPDTVARQGLWRVTQLARLASTGAAGDRRFMNEVDVVRTTYQGRPFDAVQLGSGDRTNPKAIDNNDRFYMLRDYQITPYVSDPPSFDQCTAVTNPSTDNRCRLPITEASLYDATQNLIQVGTATQVTEARTSLVGAMGWFIQLGASPGEKSLSASTTLRGITFFSTFAPSTASETRNACVPQAGTARLYALNLQDGSAAIDFNGNGALVTNDRFALLGSSVPDTPSLYFSKDQQIRLLFPAGGGPAQGTRGTGGNCGPGMLCGPRGLRPVVPTYRYEREY